MSNTPPQSPKTNDESSSSKNTGRLPAFHYAKIKDKLITLDDGYLYFWPVKNEGAYSAHDLREIADELDRRNEPWDKQVNEYFDGIPATEE